MAATLLFPLQLLAQYSLGGQVRDAAKNELLAGATIQLQGAGKGTVSDANGLFEFQDLQAGTYTLQVSFVGFDKKQVTVTLPQTGLLEVHLQRASLQAGEVVVSAIRANEKTGTTFTNVSKEQIAEQNFGQDLPYLLERTPSVVVNSEAGAGVGYTGIRIRGSDITRINVTVNGIPVNDAESHGAFFVNMPDLASSIQDIQVQRGVGTSTNGGGAFGASMNIQTMGLNREAYAETQNTYGSFNTWKHTVSFGSGLLNDKFTVDGRLSKVSSDGYIDRAFSDLKSYYFSAGYHGKTGMLKFITFSGQEKTYQAWNGLEESKLETDRTYNSTGLYTDANGNEAFYDNETDNYQQDHYQLHYSKDLAPRLNLGGAFHFTRGRGYYEQYKESQRLSNYGLAPVVVGTESITRTDLIRQKWLDNYFYGATYALNYTSENGKLDATLGGAVNQYDGDHYGEIIWARYASNSQIRQRYYFGNALKTDFNIFGKATYQLTEDLSLFGDLQYRTVNYELEGTDDDNRDVTQQASYNFINPKAGATYTLNENQSIYASFAVGNREPVRSDFTDRTQSDEQNGITPKPETLYNWEAGYRLRRNGSMPFTFDANFYYMDYKNQLVLTGQLNDVGTGLRTNIKNSYRTGLELAAQVQLHKLVTLGSNLTVSRNKIRNYSETVYSYDNDQDYNPSGEEVTIYKEADIAFSPEIISSHLLEVQPVRGLRAAFIYKTVSKQYLDNTSSENRKLNGYQVADLRLRYTLKPVFVNEIEIALLVNNVLNTKYEANGYTYSSRFDNLPARSDYNFYYPQATRNFLLSFGVKF